MSLYRNRKSITMLMPAIKVICNVGFSVLERSKYTALTTVWAKLKSETFQARAAHSCVVVLSSIKA